MRRTNFLILFAFCLAACGGSSGTVTTSGGFTGSPSSTDETSTTETVETSTTQGPTTSTGLAGETSLHSPSPVGSVVQVGDWRVRVTGVVEDGTEMVMTENEFNDPPAEGNQFFIAEIEATYTGTESSSFWVDLTLKAVGASNVAYESFESYCGVIPDDINDAGETFPGGTITGNVCWSVDSGDAGSLVMIAEESFSFESSRQFLSLDPAATPVDGTTTVVGSGTGRETVAVGDSATVGSWEITVLEVSPDATAEVLAANQFNDPPPEGYQYFVVALEAIYVGDDSSTFWVDMTLKSLGASNVAYEAFEAYCGVIPDDIDDAGETFPGGTITGNVCWSVDSEDAGSLVMIVEESFTFDGTRVFFDLTAGDG